MINTDSVSGTGGTSLGGGYSCTKGTGIDFAVCPRVPPEVCTSTMVFIGVSGRPRRGSRPVSTPNCPGFDDTHGRIITTTIAGTTRIALYANHDAINSGRARQ